jgi:hypothetical protein
MKRKRTEATANQTQETGFKQTEIDKWKSRDSVVHNSITRTRTSLEVPCFVTDGMCRPGRLHPKNGIAEKSFRADDSTADGTEIPYWLNRLSRPPDRRYEKCDRYGKKSGASFWTESPKKTGDGGFLTAEVAISASDNEATQTFAADDE